MRDEAESFSPVHPEDRVPQVRAGHIRSPLHPLLRPIFLQGVYPFLGAGLMSPHPVSPELAYTVPTGCKAVLMYVRAGNASDQMIYLSVVGDGKVRRYLPIGPQDGMHVELAIKEEIPAGTRLELHLAAGAGVLGTVVIDVGLLEWTEE